MADRNRELVPDNWSLVRERALTTGLCSEGWYSEHTGVCRRAELPGGSVKVKKFWKVARSLMRNDIKAKQRQFVFDRLQLTYYLIKLVDWLIGRGSRLLRWLVTDWFSFSGPEWERNEGDSDSSRGEVGRGQDDVQTDRRHWRWRYFWRGLPPNW